jgi:hypothetical protein
LLQSAEALAGIAAGGDPSSNASGRKSVAVRVPVKVGRATLAIGIVSHKLEEFGVWRDSMDVYLRREGWDAE